MTWRASFLVSRVETNATSGIRGRLNGTSYSGGERAVYRPRDRSGKPHSSASDQDAVGCAAQAVYSALSGGRSCEVSPESVSAPSDAVELLGVIGMPIQVMLLAAASALARARSAGLRRYLDIAARHHGGRACRGRARTHLVPLVLYMNTPVANPQSGAIRRHGRGVAVGGVREALRVGAHRGRDGVADAPTPRGAPAGSLAGSGCARCRSRRSGATVHRAAAAVPRPVHGLPAGGGDRRPQSAYGRSRAWRAPAVYYYNTWYMWVHPPLLFFAYGTFVISFVATIQMVRTRYSAFEETAYRWARIGYLPLTAACCSGSPGRSWPGRASRGGGRARSTCRS